MSLTDTIARITQLQSQIASLGGAFSPAAPTTSTAGTPASTSSFAGTLAQAQASNVAAAADVSGPSSAYPGQPGAAVGSASYPGSPYGVPPFAAAAGTGAGAPLSAAAQGMLTSGQQQFVSRLAADTGLSTQVISAWVLAEESGGGAQSREAASNNDWLNIGYTDSATYGASDAVWSDPSTAADATAGWLKGQNTIPGYGTASSGIQAILATAGQPPQAQIAAIQQSGWASSGYPDLPALFQQVA